MRNSQKGITLIALIITIVIMLILAGVTISIVVNGGLFNQAQNAVDQTKEAADKESIGIADAAAIMEKSGATSEPQIGDYVNYGDYLKAKTYTAAIAQTGYTSDQTFTTETDTKWKVLDVTGNQITLVSEEPMNTSNGIDNNGLYLQGATGYNNAETVLNNMCSTLYTTSKGVGRSMTWDDVAKVTGFDQLPIEAKAKHWYYDTMDDFASSYQATYNYTNAYTPDVNNGTTQTNFSATNTWEKMDYSWEYTGSDIPYSLDTLGLVIPRSIFDMVFGPDVRDYNYDNAYYYWLASRAVNANSSGAGFEVGGVGYGYADSGFDGLFDSYGGSGSYDNSVRPAVSLQSNVQLIKRRSHKWNSRMEHTVKSKEVQFQQRGCKSLCGLGYI